MEIAGRYAVAEKCWLSQLGRAGHLLRSEFHYFDRTKATASDLQHCCSRVDADDLNIGLIFRKLILRHDIEDEPILFPLSFQIPFAQEMQIGKIGCF